VLVALLVLGGFLYRAYTLPEVYESDALVELKSDRGSDASSSVGERLRGALFDTRTVERVALDSASHVQHESDKLGGSMTERARRAIDFRPAGDMRFTVSYRAPTAALARRGCESLTNAAAERLAAQRSASAISPHEEARQRARLVEERTRELAAFVAQHPELAGKKNEPGDAFLGVPGMRPPSTPAPAPTVDSVLPILLQQKARLEERIAFVERVELGGVDESADKLPPSDTLAKMDRASLQKMLVQVKAAIAARQTAAERARANSPSESPPEGTAPAEPPPPTPVQVEWQRLVQAVVDAQQQVGRDGAATPALHVVRAANMPHTPISPNRRLLTLLGVTVGLWAGILWAFARTILGHVRTAPAQTQYLPEGLPAFPLEGEAPAAPTEATAAPLVAAKAAAAAAPAAATPAAVPDALALTETEALPSFPMEAESAKAVDEATLASRAAVAKTATPVPAKPAVTPTPPVAVARTATPVPAKPAVTPTPAPPVAVAAPPLPAPPTAVVEVPGALPSFPMDAELAKAVEEATLASRAAVKPAAEQGLPKVIIAAEAAAAPAEPKSSALPSFPMDLESTLAAERAAAAARLAATQSAAVPSTAAATTSTVASSTAAAPPSPAASSAAAPSNVAAAASKAPDPAEPPAPAPEKGFPVLVVDGAQRTSVAPNAPVERAPYALEPSPYAAVAEAARISSVPPPPDPTAAARAAADARRPSRDSSWYTDSPAATGPARSAPSQAKPAPMEESYAHAVAGGRIEASPIMGIEEGMSTAASGKQGISVYPPPVAPVAPPAPASPASPASHASPGATMRLGSVSPSDIAAAAERGSAHSSRRVTQAFGSPLVMTPSTAPSLGWTPPPAFGAHQMPPRESDPPAGLASIPPPPKYPSLAGTPAQGSPITSSRPAATPAVQSLPLTPPRAPAVQAPAPLVEAPSTALAVARPHQARTRSEPPAASSIVCDVPKGWAPHPTLIENDASEELAALRDQLYRLAARECFVVGVSSGPEMAAYKSGVAGRLAWMLAQPGHARVLLMEGDFDHPVVHRLMRIDMPIASGFSEQMRRRMNGSPPGPWTIVRCAPNLYVLAEGLVRSPGLLPTVHFADSVSELRRAYDLIVIDGPAGGMSVDTRALDSVADGVVLAGDADLLDRASTWFGKKQLMAVVSAGPRAPVSR
jgi:Mrp family chromosome partitioning ATPase